MLCGPIGNSLHEYCVPCFSTIWLSNLMGTLQSGPIGTLLSATAKLDFHKWLLSPEAMNFLNVNADGLPIAFSRPQKQQKHPHLQLIRHFGSTCFSSIGAQVSRMIITKHSKLTCHLKEQYTSTVAIKEVRAAHLPGYGGQQGRQEGYSDPGELLRQHQLLWWTAPHMLFC